MVALGILWNAKQNDFTENDFAKDKY